MASFKPASYFPSSPLRRRRRSFVRKPSSSSLSARSEDSDTGVFPQSGVNTPREMAGTGNAAPTSPGTPDGISTSPVTPASEQPPVSTPGRKRTKPIAIEMPGRTSGPSSYTPLSARGDIQGGYFPNHEDHRNSYQPHPFGESRSKKVNRGSAPSSPLHASSTASSSENSPVLAPSSTATAPSSSFNHASLTMPLGKYHPSNYKITSPTPKVSATPSVAPAPPELSLPPAKSSSRPHHRRQGSDVKQKLQQYQRAMIEQARVATALSGPDATAPKPTSPKLHPLGTVGPITPLELEESLHAGYLVAGSLGKASTIYDIPTTMGPPRDSAGTSNQQEQDAIDKIIKAEEERWMKDAGSSYATKV